ncbi:MAG: hypothetical protein GJ680_18545 [Alteromonadaceae bacterium]|nr:hypothetical protein [Alteromonadaceae bacterium]
MKLFGKDINIFSIVLWLACLFCIANIIASLADIGLNAKMLIIEKFGIGIYVTTLFLQLAATAIIARWGWKIQRSTYPKNNNY